MLEKQRDGRIQNKIDRGILNPDTVKPEDGINKKIYKGRIKSNILPLEEPDHCPVCDEMVNELVLIGFLTRYFAVCEHCITYDFIEQANAVIKDFNYEMDSDMIIQLAELDRPEPIESKGKGPMMDMPLEQKLETMTRAERKAKNKPFVPPL